MTKYRNRLPQMKDKIFLTDSGLETTLVFLEKMDLPCFAAFPLLRDEDGRARIADYYRKHAHIALRNGAGFVLESVTWRANRDWAEKLGIGAAELARLNREAIALLVQLRNEMETAHSPMVISGNIGPRGDGYVPGSTMSIAEAEEYHSEQAAILASTEADMLAAFTMNYVEEAAGIARAGAKLDIPVAISFTVETDGNLATGQRLQDAIAEVDDAAITPPAYFMINCAHPTHFYDAIERGERWTSRIRGIRANASRRSHAELDCATELDAGNPAELGVEYRDLRERFGGKLSVLGGCCGTDHRHVEAIAASCLPQFKLAG
jgi:S-methylmethionine-dependent homocysteine/selenocysteine methylase